MTSSRNSILVATAIACVILLSLFTSIIPVFGAVLGGIVFISLSGVAVYYLNGKQKVVTPLNLFVGLVMLTVFTGSWLMSIRGEIHARAPLLIGMGLASTLLGAATANISHRFFPRIALRDYARKPTTLYRYENALYGMCWLFLVISSTVVLVYYRGHLQILSSLRDIIQQTALETVQRDLSDYRFLVTKGHLFNLAAYRGQGIMRQFRDGILPLVTVVAVVASSYSRKRYRWVILSIIGALLTYVFMASEGRRSTLFFFTIALITAVTYINRNEFSRNRMIALGLIGFGSVGVLGLSVLLPRFVIGDSPIANFQESLVRRLLFSQARTTSFIFESFPKHIPFYGGQIHATKLISTIPGASLTLNFANVLAQSLLGRSDVTTYASSTSYGLLYADFGTPGVVIGGFLVGFLLQSITIVFSRQPKDPVRLATYILLTSTLAQASFGSILTPIYVGGLGVIAIFFVFVMQERLLSHRLSTG